MIFSYFKPKYSKEIGTWHWQPFETAFAIAIPATEHKRGSAPRVQVDWLNRDHYEHVHCDVLISDAGDVMVRSPTDFNGRITLS